MNPLVSLPDTVIIDPSILWIAYAIAVLVTILSSAALLYHWKKFSFGDRRVKKGQNLYLAGTLAILICAGIILVSLM